MEFRTIAEAIKTQFKKMSKQDLFSVNVDKNELWDLYLKSFPEGTDPLYKERTEHDCNCCKNFIRDVGDVVYIKNNKLVSVWDVNVGGYYQTVVDAMSAFVKKRAIVDTFSHAVATAGADKTRQLLESGAVKTWNHFFCNIPSQFVDVTPEKLNESRTTKQVFKRGLDEISSESVEIVLELIDQNSLYRGEEHKRVVKLFLDLKKEFGKLSNPLEADNFCWANLASHGARIRNTAIGTLLQDISEGVELDKAVKSFETKVAPTNYKRPTSLITKRMVDQAMTQIKELGIEDSLYRRFATVKDLSVNNVLFSDRAVTPAMKDGLLDSLMDEVKTDVKSYSTIEDIQIEEFVKLIPSIKSMEILFENKHTSNLMNLIAPKNDDTPNILKWNNNFSWSYNGNVTDSIRERVKKAGGNVEGILRTSLSWFNFDDLDIHVVEPGKNKIYYGRKTNEKTSGKLDVDMNADGGNTRDAVENVVWTNRAKMGKGEYKVIVNNFCKRETSNPGFVVEMEIGGKLDTFSYSKAVRNNEDVIVMTFRFDGEKVTDIKTGNGVVSKAMSQKIWNIETEKFQKVSMLTTSPNHWDDNEVGNKHHFFILDKCSNPEKARGFYNEFVKRDLEKHRKVFEVLGDKTKCEESSEQVSGVGFSSTKKDSVVCRVAGNFNRTLRVNF